MTNWDRCWSAYRRRKDDLHILICLGISAVFWTLFTWLWFSNCLPR